MRKGCKRHIQLKRGEGHACLRRSNHRDYHLVNWKTQSNANLGALYRGHFILASYQRRIAQKCPDPRSPTGVAGAQYSGARHRESIDNDTTPQALSAHNATNPSVS